MDVTPNLWLCWMRLKALLGRGGAASVKSLSNIGEGVVTVWYALAYRSKHTVFKERSVAFMVYVINSNGQPLMPTKRHGKVRRLLKAGLAKVVQSCPFTIQLQYEAEENTQPVVLGVDAGSKHVGFSACTEKEELYTEEMRPRNDVVSLLADRRQFRRSRRNRKTRYRQARFDNKTHSKHKGWLAPSVEVKIQEHITCVKRIMRILPISKVVVETAEFDLQRLKAMEEGKPLPVGTDYQLGEMYNAYNVRQYVLKRDHYTCQCCGKHPTAKSEVKLHVHHKESRKTGGNAPNNLITLCADCHRALHEGKVRLPEGGRRGKPNRDAAFMGIMRKTLLERLRSELNVPVGETHGYITKYRREKYGIQKTHVSDAKCIAGYPEAKTADETFLKIPVRCHNRQIHKAKILKGGIRKRNQAEYTVFGYRRWDKVMYNHQECFIKGRRSSGYFALCRLDGSVVTNSASYKKLKLLEAAGHYLTERISRGTGVV